MEVESTMVGAGGWGKGETGSCCLVSIKFQSYKMKSPKDLLYNIMLRVNNTVVYS